MFFTTLANVVTAIGFALLLVVASELAGGIADWRQGMFWGLAAFAVVIIAPGLGLPPELPGMPAAEISARQTWWIGTAIATAAGLALILLGAAFPWRWSGWRCWSRRTWSARRSPGATTPTSRPTCTSASW